MAANEDKLLKQFVHWMINDPDFKWEGSHSQTVDVHDIAELIHHHKLTEVEADSINQRALRTFLEVYDSYFPPNDAPPVGLTFELELLSKKYPWRQIVDTVHRIDTGEAS